MGFQETRTNEWSLWDTKLKNQWVSGCINSRDWAFDWPSLASCLPLRHLKGEPANRQPITTAPNCIGAHPSRKTEALFTVGVWKVPRQAIPTDVRRRHLRLQESREQEDLLLGFSKSLPILSPPSFSSVSNLRWLPLCFSLFANADYWQL